MIEGERIANSLVERREKLYGEILEGRTVSVEGKKENGERRVRR